VTGLAIFGHGGKDIENKLYAKNIMYIRILKTNI
jgi:hypothetical protein